MKVENTAWFFIHRSSFIIDHFPENIGYARIRIDYLAGVPQNAKL
jgi:hypothetical protein